MNAMTGDLILFKSTTMISKVQRKITNSDYDHVAMVIRDKFEASEVFLLEAVNSGVQLSRWSYVRNFLLSETNMINSRSCFYEKIAYRAVKTNRNKWFQDMVEDFMIQSLGKAYEISY